MIAPSVKELARSLVERLPDKATWDDLEYEFYVRRVIDAVVAESVQRSNRIGEENARARQRDNPDGSITQR